MKYDQEIKEKLYWFRGTAFLTGLGSGTILGAGLLSLISKVAYDNDQSQSLSYYRIPIALAGFGLTIFAALDNKKTQRELESNLESKLE